MALLTDNQIISIIDKAIKNRTESSNVEFKDARGGMPSQLWKTISSFSHQPGGGLIALGIKEDRPRGKIEVVGGLELAPLQEKIISHLNDVMKNHGQEEIRIINFQNQQLLVLIISETPDELKPCFNKKLGLPNGACIRQGNTDRVITDEEMRSFIRNSAVYKFDRTQAMNTSLSSLSVEKIELFLKKSAEKVGRVSVNNKPSFEIMRNLGIAELFEGNEFPTVAGYLIFSKDMPQNINPFTRYIVRCVRYQGISVSTPIIDKQDVAGTLDQQIDAMQKFILRNISRKANIVGTKRIERYAYPEDAIRELVANAVIHRDYMITETYTHINVFSNRIEISNPGNLPPGITIENIKDSQFSRNEVIANILRDLDYLEEYGRGIDIVFSRMSEWGLMEPLFKNTSNSFKAALLGDTFNALNDRQIKIWYFLQDNKQVTAKGCEKLFPNVSRPTLNNDLRGLVNIGLIVAKGSSNNVYYEPQY